MDLIIAGKDCVATDSVGSAVMGFSENEMPRHIKISQEMGFGTYDLNRIKFLGGVSVEEVRKDFERTGPGWSWR
jgi:uncharacterized protein (DUF362 family)